MFDKILLHLLLESRKSVALETIKGEVADYKFLKLKNVFEEFDLQEKARPNLGGKKFSDKYPMFILRLLSSFFSGFGDRENRVYIDELNFYLNRLELIYRKLTPEEKDAIPLFSSYHELDKYLKAKEYQRSEAGKQLFLNKLNVAQNLIAKKEAAVIYKDEKKNILVLRAYTYNASVALGQPSWCVSSPNTDKYFYSYQTPDGDDTKIFFLYFFNMAPKSHLFSQTAVQVSDYEKTFWDFRDYSHTEEEFLEEISQDKYAYDLSKEEIENIVDIIDTAAMRDPGIQTQFDADEYEQQLNYAVSKKLRKYNLQGTFDYESVLDDESAEVRITAYLTFPGVDRKFASWLKYIETQKDVSKLPKNILDTHNSLFNYFIDKIYLPIANKTTFDLLEQIGGDEYEEVSNKVDFYLSFSSTQKDRMFFEVRFSFDHGKDVDDINYNLENYDDLFSLLEKAFSNNELEKEIYRVSGVEHGKVNQNQMSLPKAIKENKNIKLKIKFY